MSGSHCRVGNVLPKVAFVLHLVNTRTVGVNCDQFLTNRSSR